MKSKCFMIMTKLLIENNNIIKLDQDNSNKFLKYLNKFQLKNQLNLNNQ